MGRPAPSHVGGCRLSPRRYWLLSVRNPAATCGWQSTVVHPRAPGVPHVEQTRETPLGA
ncbi:MAG TPA: hypothetical protein VLM89_04725 [Phycisphaerae bacterium]|nr:hypothetical protein [Phycisphaerae bacterium]